MHSFILRCAALQIEVIWLPEGLTAVFYHNSAAVAYKAYLRLGCQMHKHKAGSAPNTECVFLQPLLKAFFSRCSAPKQTNSSRDPGIKIVLNPAKLVLNCTHSFDE